MVVAGFTAVFVDDQGNVVGQGVGDYVPSQELDCRVVGDQIEVVRSKARIRVPATPGIRHTGKVKVTVTFSTGGIKTFDADLLHSPLGVYTQSGGIEVEIPDLLITVK